MPKEGDVPMSIGRICVREVDVIDAGDSIHEAARRMRDRAVGTLLVLDDTKQPIGIVTDRDLVVRALAEAHDAATVSVRAVMTPNPKTIFEEAPIESALGLMTAGGFRRLPVVDRQGKLVGIVTLDDVMTLLAEELTVIGKLLERQAPHPTAAVRSAR